MRILLYYIKILFKTAQLYLKKDSSAYASHITLSGLFALFPFAVFSTSLAAVLGAKDYIEQSTNFLFSLFPKSLITPLLRNLSKVLTLDHGGILTLSFLATAIFASNGIEALRAALNYSYDLKEEHSFLWCRMQSLGFVLMGTLILLIASFLLFFIPFTMKFSSRFSSQILPYLPILKLWRYGLIFGILAAALLR